MKIFIACVMPSNMAIIDAERLLKCRRTGGGNEPLTVFAACSWITGDFLGSDVAK